MLHRPPPPHQIIGKAVHTPLLHPQHAPAPVLTNKESNRIFIYLKFPSTLQVKTTAAYFSHKAKNRKQE